MFYLDRGRCSSRNGKNCGKTEEDEFGWWLNDEGIQSTSSPIKNFCPEVSMECCLTSQANRYVYAKDFTSCNCQTADEEATSASGNKSEKIEMLPLMDAATGVDLTMIERDAGHFSTNSESINDSDNSTRLLGRSYTPERLVQMQQYRIITPSPRYFSVPRARPTSPDDGYAVISRCRRDKLAKLIDPHKVGAEHLQTLLESNSRRGDVSCKTLVGSNASSNSSRVGEIPKCPSTTFSQGVASIGSQCTLDFPNSRLSYDSRTECDDSWENGNKATCRSSRDTSGIQSNDWSSGTPSDLRSPLCPYDEVANASITCVNDASKQALHKPTAITEVLSILERLKGGSQPTIIDDGLPENANHQIPQFRLEVEKLQETSREINKDICTLKSHFLNEERRISSLRNEITKLREDISEMRYMDDLLNLLRGELDKISQRKWPFALGRAERYTGDINLVV